MMFTFRAMNTDVEVTVRPGEAAIADGVALIFAEAEERFSRFREDSELSALNRAEGPFSASTELYDALVRARAYVEMTDGLFEPSIYGTLAALGYNRSLALGTLDQACAVRRPRVGRFLDVALNPIGRVVVRPAHVQIDLGGMAKGSTVDRAARLLRGWGAVDAGGDAVMVGSGPDGGKWLVEVEDPLNPARTLVTLAVSDTAVATSSGNRRQWRVGKKLVHHLIDPRTQDSSKSDLLQATVFAPTAELSDVLAKTAFLLGTQQGRRFIQRQPGIGAVLVPRNAAPILIGALDVREAARG